MYVERKRRFNVALQFCKNSTRTSSNFTRPVNVAGAELTDLVVYIDADCCGMLSAKEYFKKHCDELLCSLTEEDVNNFKNLVSDEERVKYGYSHAKRVPIKMSESGKSRDKALYWKNSGNKFYTEKNSSGAIESYNSGIVVCPQDTGEAKELLAVLIANRSAVLYEEKQYVKACNDITYVRNLDAYPKRLQLKILMRQAKCYSQLNNAQEALDAYVAASAAITDANLSPVQLSEKQKEIKQSLEEVKQKITDYDMQIGLNFAKIDTVPFVRSKQYPAVSVSVQFSEDSFQGRFAIAARDIEPGEFVIQESPHCLAVAFENVLRNCTHCGLSTTTPYPCKGCAFAVYCSQKCAINATCHQYECDILPTMYSSGASINCIMALRMITQNDFEYFWQNRQKLFAPSVGKGETYVHSDYIRAYNLCTNSGLRPNGEFVHYTFMAIFFLRLLKKTKYFPYTCDDGTFTDEENFIGSLILRHLQILQFNAHEISELRNLPVKEENGLDYEAAHVGGALYPTLSLFNHSCEPSIVRYCKGNQITARAVKLIRRGEIIFENYGPIYSSQERNLRRSRMKKKYWFDCHCVPCEKRWPLFDEMSDEFLPLSCKRCKCVHSINKNVLKPTFECYECGLNNSILPALMQLMTLESITKKADVAFERRDFKTAGDIYCQALSVYYKYLVPPFPDLVKTQQRLRTCMLHDGIKQEGYTGPNYAL